VYRQDPHRGHERREHFAGERKDVPFVDCYDDGEVREHHTEQHDADVGGGRRVERAQRAAEELFAKQSAALFAAVGMTLDDIAAGEDGAVAVWDEARSHPCPQPYQRFHPRGQGGSVFVPRVRETRIIVSPRTTAIAVQSAKFAMQHRTQ
jgi:hypothetical protein